MNEINLDALACPNCGTSGADNLTADEDTERGTVSGTGWITCPDCGSHVDFTEDGEVLESNMDSFEWAVQLCSALEGVPVADAMGQ